MNQMHPDRTPVTVTLPAHAWRSVLKVVEKQRRHHARRSADRSVPSGADLDGMLAGTLAEASEAIRAATE